MHQYRISGLTVVTDTCLFVVDSRPFSWGITGKDEASLVNDGSVPSSVPVNHDSESACGRLRFAAVVKPYVHGDTHSKTKMCVGI